MGEREREEGERKEVPGAPSQLCKIPPLHSQGQQFAIQRVGNLTSPPTSRSRLRPSQQKSLIFPFRLPSPTPTTNLLLSTAHLLPAPQESMMHLRSRTRIARGNALSRLQVQALSITVQNDFLGKVNKMFMRGSLCSAHITGRKGSRLRVLPLLPSQDASRVDLSVVWPPIP